MDEKSIEKKEIDKLEKEREKLIIEEQNIIDCLVGNHNPTPDEEYYEVQREIEMNSPEYRLDEITKYIEKIDERIGAYRRAEFLKKNLVEINKNSTKSLTKDYLNRTELAKAIANLIMGQEENDKLSIGILGEWGSGKSTFLKIIQKELEGDTNVVQFNASKYDDQEQIWYSLLQSVSEKYLSNKETRFKKIRYIYKSIVEKKELGLVFGTVIIPILFIYLTTRFSEFLKEPNVSFLGVSTGVLSIITGFLSFDFIKRFYSILKEYFIGNDKDKFIKQLAYPNYKKYLGTRENVRQDLIVFKDLIIKSTKSNKTSKNLIIFIDELDRCSDKTIINFFSSIEAFIDIPGITFVFSINPEIIYPVVANAIPSRQLSEKEKNHSNQTKIGAEFIEKYINIFITLPVSFDYSLYIKEILDGIIREEEVEKLNSLINSIAHDKKTSPREIKKLLDLILIYNRDFVDLTFLEFSTLLIMKYYYEDFMRVFAKINSRSNVLIKNFGKMKFEISESKNTFNCMLELLGESNMNCINRSIGKIERILSFT